MSRSLAMFAAILAVALLNPAARANSVVLSYSPCKAGFLAVAGDFGPGQPPQFNVPIPVPTASGQHTRDLVLNWLLVNTTLAVTPLDPDALVIRNVAPGVAVNTLPGNTAATLRITTAAPTSGSIQFPGHFLPPQPPILPATFTAGIVTDVGVLTETVSAAELNFQTDGPIICQALFQRLAPRAPQYGAQINYAGDRLEVYFDPAYTITGGGILGGTTSSTPGASAGVSTSSPPPPAVRFTFSDTPGGQSAFFVLADDVFNQLFAPMTVPYPVPLPASPARDQAVQTLQTDYDLPLVPFGPQSALLIGPPTASAGHRIGTTASTMKIDKPAAGKAEVKFNNVFNPWPPPATQPAVFTAGIVTDVGELKAQVSAAELNFQTDGPIICQALFQRLAPRAPQYGAQINYAGDRLEVYFDPAYTVTQGGIIFGTTSPSPGCEGVIDPPVLPLPPNGDLNGDGRRNGLDIQPFVDLLWIDPDHYLYWSRFPTGDPDQADFDTNGVIDPLDIPLCEAALLGQAFVPPSH